MESSRPTILTSVRCYLPGNRWGGPIRSIANTVELLGEEFRFRIVTSDRDAGDARPYPGQAADTWTRVGKAEVLYLSPARQGLSGWRQIFREERFDILYLNSFLDPRFSLPPLLLRRLQRGGSVPAIIAPRGEFGRGALQLKSWKKQPYRYLMRTLGLLDGIIWHASTPREAQEIHMALGSGGGAPERSPRVQVAPGLVILAGSAPGASNELPWNSRSVAQDHGLRVCFLARISRVKNLPFALRVLGHVTCPVTFNVYGPIESQAHLRECASQLDALPAGVKVNFCGAVAYAEVVPTIAQHDLYILPTLSENFGHSIVDAWAAGVPVLISDRTPWRNLKEKGVGWDLPLEDPEGFAAVIDSVAAMTSPERAAMRHRCLAFAEQLASEERSVDTARDRFLSALHGGAS